VSLTTRVIQASGSYKLVSYHIDDGENLVIPERSLILHHEPIMQLGEDDEPYISGFYVWALIPEKSVLTEIRHET